METFIITVVVLAFTVLFVILYNSDKFASSEKKDEDNSFVALLKKPVEELTEAEKQKILRFASQAANHGDISFAQYDVIRAKYNGTESFADHYGGEYTMALSNKISADMELQKYQKQKEKNIIYSGALGSAIGGTAGAIIGATTAASKANATEIELLEKQQKAQLELSEAKMQIKK